MSNSPPTSLLTDVQDLLTRHGYDASDMLIHQKTQPQVHWATGQTVNGHQSPFAVCNNVRRQFIIGCRKTPRPAHEFCGKSRPRIPGGQRNTCIATEIHRYSTVFWCSG